MAFMDYAWRWFVTSDARQYAYQDNWVAPNDMQGEPGKMVQRFMTATEAPRQFQYNIAINSWGGNPYNPGVAQPLINNPAFTGSYLEDQ